MLGFPARAAFTCTAFAAFAAFPATAEMRQFSNSIFVVPPGWEVLKRTPEFQLLSPDDDQPCGNCYFYIGRSQPASGQLRDFIEANPRLFLDDDDESVKSLGPVEEGNEAGYPFAMKGLKVDGDLMVLAGYQVGDRFQPIGFRGDMDDAEQIKQSADGFKSFLSGLLLTTRYVSNGAPPLMPRAQPGPLNGAYFGTWMQSSLGMDMMMRMDARSHLLVFWPNGYYHDGSPPNGLTPPDPATLREPTDTDYGTYTVAGNQVTLAMADGTFDTLTIEDGALNDGRATLYPVEPLPDGSTMAGSISWFYYSGFSPAVGSGGVHSSSVTVFRKDGTYGGESSGGASAGFTDGAGNSTGGFTASNSSSDAGRYEIRNGLLTRYPADGSEPTARLVFKRGDEIIIGEDVLNTD
ncbi:hypothetical protein [Paracoccus pacificus]|uniref:Uncharacterized protein n=1 Tax=Paracoccus pacificus TaxID=1463598 RepID=A0ABW4R9D1_9RHOB